MPMWLADFGVGDLLRCSALSFLSQALFLLYPELTVLATLVGIILSLPPKPWDCRCTLVYVGTRDEDTGLQVSKAHVLLARLSP